MKSITISITYLVFCLLLTLVACNETEDSTPAIPPASEDATFSYTFAPDDPNRVIFTAEPGLETWYTHWDFGDATAAEGTQVEKTYFLAGDYEVRFKIFTDGGTAATKQTVTIDQDILGANLVQNGAFDEGGEFWNTLPISGGVDVVIDNGVANWSGGNWGQVGIYQAIDVEANTLYQVNMDISGSGMTDCWFEVYGGTAVPAAGNDYNDGGIRLGLNTWDGCGSEAFNGPFTTLSCSNGGGNGTFELPSTTTAYLVIRSGGVDLGTEGVSIDNITIREL